MEEERAREEGTKREVVERFSGLIEGIKGWKDG